MLPKLPHKSPGFTLIEILISIAIISLVGIVFFPNLRKFNTDQQFKNEVLGIKTDLKKAQTMYTTGTRCTGSKATIGWSSLLTIGTNIGYQLKATCIDSALAQTTELLPIVTAVNTSLVSSSCPSAPTTIEFLYDKNGFSYSCNGALQFTKLTNTNFDLQLRNKNNTGQTTTITINPVGTISQN